MNKELKDLTINEFVGPWQGHTIEMNDNRIREDYILEINIPDKYILTKITLNKKKGKVSFTYNEKENEIEMYLDGVKHRLIMIGQGEFDTYFKERPINFKRK